MEQIIILDDEELRFDYTDVEIAKFRTYWKEYSKHTKNTIVIVNQVAEDLNMSADNVFLLALDQMRKGRLK